MMSILALVNSFNLIEVKIWFSGEIQVLTFIGECEASVLRSQFN